MRPFSVDASECPSGTIETPIGVSGGLYRWSYRNCCLYHEWQVTCKSGTSVHVKIVQSLFARRAIVRVRVGLWKHFLGVVDPRSVSLRWGDNIISRDRGSAGPKVWRMNGTDLIAASSEYVSFPSRIWVSGDHKVSFCRLCDLQVSRVPVFEFGVSEADRDLVFPSDGRWSPILPEGFDADVAFDESVVSAVSRMNAKNGVASISCLSIELAWRYICEYSL